MPQTFTLAVTPLYAALIAILMAVLSTATAAKRGSSGVALGDGGDPGMALAIRRFGNLSEYAAMAVLMLLLMELSGIAARWLHSYGIALVLLRLLHPVILFDSMAVPAWKKAGRIVAGAGTALLLLVSGIALLMRAL